LHQLRSTSKSFVSFKIFSENFSQKKSARNEEVNQKNDRSEKQALPSCLPKTNDDQGRRYCYTV
jgi:hypothetical protein